MSNQNKSSIQYTVEELKSLVQKVCYQKQISKYHFHFGPKKYTQHQFVALLILYAKSGKSLREFILYLYESKWPEWLNLKEIPSKSSIHRHFERIGMAIIRVLNLTIVKLKESLHYAIDSTGVDSYQASKHYEKRINRVRRPYLKLSVIGQTTKPHMIEDFSITDKHKSDFNHWKPLIKRFHRNNKIIFADKAGDGEEMHMIAEQSKNMLYCPLREKSKNPKGRLRRQMKKMFDEDIYHERNKIETIMFLLKHKGLVTRSKKRNNKFKELAWKILAYNIERASKFLEIIWGYIISRDSTLFSETHCVPTEQPVGGILARLIIFSSKLANPFFLIITRHRNK